METLKSLKRYAITKRNVWLSKQLELLETEIKQEIKQEIKDAIDEAFYENYGM